MNRLSATRILLLGSVAMGGIAWADSAPKEVISELTTSTVEVQKVDPRKRELTLKGMDGNQFTVQVPANVTGLEEINRGDRINLSYYESIMVSLRKPGEPAAPPSEMRFRQRSGGNEPPGGIVGEQITATAEVMKIDRTEHRLTIKAPDGALKTILVKDPQNQAAFEKVKVGDKIQVTFTEAVAATVTPQK